MREDETLLHFVGRCPVLKEFRIRHFGKLTIDERELVSILNGIFDGAWNMLYNYVTSALKYRNNIIIEFR